MDPDEAARLGLDPDDPSAVTSVTGKARYRKGDQARQAAGGSGKAPGMSKPAPGAKAPGGGNKPAAGAKPSGNGKVPTGSNGHAKVPVRRTGR